MLDHTAVCIMCPQSRPSWARTSKVTRLHGLSNVTFRIILDPCCSGIATRAPAGFVWAERQGLHRNPRAELYQPSLCGDIRPDRSR